MNKILIIDDEKLFGETLKEELLETGLYECQYVEDETQALEFSKIKFDLILLDLRLNNHSGLNALEIILKTWPTSRVYIMTGFGTIATAVSAIKLGASDYLTKPITIEKITNLINHENISTEDIGSEAPLSLDRMEREYIEHILAQEKGNITKAAKKLGLHRQSLQRKLKKWVPFK